MPIKLTADSFLNLLKHSGLIEVDRLNHVLNDLKGADVNFGDAREIANALVSRQVLTRWQADKLLQGKRGFFLGKYRLKSLLGKGGMSSVYLAEHVLMRRPCAIKVLPTKRVDDSSYLARFHREAQAVAALDHPNIVRAYDVDQQKEKNADIHFLVMEYVKGHSLQDLVMNHGPLGFLEAADYIRQAAAGLEHAHQAGLVHRDVKPGNLLVDKAGTVKVLDLGLARFFNEGNEASLTLSNDERVLGTADYLAPEQALDSHGVDHRADIYSLGCTLYFLLTGHPPFTEGTLAQRLMCHQTRRPPAITIDRPDAPPSLVAIVERMMAKRADDRYPTADDVRAALESWLLTNADDDWIQRHAGVAGSGSGVALERRSESSVIMSLDDTAAEVPMQRTPPSSFPCLDDPDLAAFLSSFQESSPERTEQAPVSSSVVENSTAENDDSQQADSGVPHAAWESLFPNRESDSSVRRNNASDARGDEVRRAEPSAKESPHGSASTNVPVAKPVDSPATFASPAEPVDRRKTAPGHVPSRPETTSGTPPIPDPSDAPVVPAAEVESPPFIPPEPKESTQPAADDAPDSGFQPEAFPWEAAPVETADGVFPEIASEEGLPEFPPVVAESHPLSGSNHAPVRRKNGPQWSATGSGKRTLAGVTALLVPLMAWGMWAWTTDDPNAEVASTASTPETAPAENPTALPRQDQAGAEPARRELHVGADGEFRTISAALAYVAQHRADYDSLRRSARVVIRVAGGRTYSESLVIKNTEATRYPAGLQILAEGSQPAVLTPSTSGPVVRLAGLDRFVLENFEIRADGRAVAIDLAGQLIDSRLRALEITGFTTAGIQGSGITGLLEEEVVLEELEFHGDSAQAAGVRLIGTDEPAASRVKIQKCRFFGPLAAGISIQSDASYLEIRQCIFADTEAGIHFADSRPTLREVLIANNTFYQTGRGIVFASMPHDSSRELAFLRNLFAGLDGPEAVIETGYSDAAFNRMLSTNGTAIENNWSDRPAPQSPAAGERNLMLRPQRERVQRFSFASTDSSEAKFLAPAPKSPHATIRGTRRGLQPFVGAVGPDVPRLGHQKIRN